MNNHRKTSVSGGRSLKSEHRSCVIYNLKKNKDERYDGYNLFHYAELKANDSIKV